MLNSLIGAKDQHNASDKIAQSLKIIVDEVLKVLNNNKKDLKETEKTFIREAVTDFFASLLSEAKKEDLVSRYKQEI